MDEVESEADDLMKRKGKAGDNKITIQEVNSILLSVKIF